MGSAKKETIDVQEAMDNLAAICDINMESPPVLGIDKNRRIITLEEEFGPNTVEWISAEGDEPIFHIMALTYRAIHEHLMKLMRDPEMNWDNPKIESGIASMMALVGASSTKMDAYLQFRSNKPLEERIGELKELKALQNFYSGSFALKFTGEESSEEDGGEDEDGGGLQDFDTVVNDLAYELFYIRKENGRPYFTKELLRNIRLACNFDLSGDSFEEDPLLKVRAMQDRDLQASAGQILDECQPAIADFYKAAHGLEENQLAVYLGMAITALFLAVNPHSLLQNTSGKSCMQYFNDFHGFLRKALESDEYQKLIAYPPDKSDKDSHLLLYLAHALARSFFERAGGVKLETIGLIHRTMRKGEEIKKKNHEHLKKENGIWNQFLYDDEKFRTLLAQFPNGPLFKILDLVTEEQDEDTNIPFDPIGQGNLPLRLYEIEKKGQKISVLRFACPTRQASINKVEIIGEFQGFLRALSQDKKKRKHLLINLQDRTSWQEFTRSKSLENLQMNAEFNAQLVVLTLPKNTDFYYQNNEYLSLNKADEFTNVLLAHFESMEDCGFFLPPEMKKKDLTRFAEEVVPLIHEHFFQNKETLSRRNREDFIEIFYQFFILKCIELLQPHSLSFTCKDAIDAGSGATAAFFGFLQLLTADLKLAEEQDFLRFLLYTPALFIRERAINQERFNRAISMLEKVDRALLDKKGEILKKFAKIYDPDTLKSIKVKHF